MQERHSERLGGTPLDNCPDEELISVLFVSDEVLFRQAVAIAVAQEEDWLIVSEAGDIDEAVKRIHLDKPDIVLLHIRRPAASGLEGVDRLLQADRDMTIVVLFEAIDHSSTKAAMQAGVAGCLDCSVDISQLMGGLRAAANGDLALSQAVARLMATMLRNGNGLEASLNGAATPPTPREVKVLELMSLGLTNRAIANRLSLSESTVRAHVRSISQKLGTQNRVQAVARALSVGMIGEGDRRPDPIEVK